MDLTNFRENQEPQKTKTILTAYFRLDKKSMLKALSCDRIMVNGLVYKVPEHTLLECLMNRNYGETKLELEQIV